MKYKLSVRLMTYMHADFVDMALKGILDQKTNFPVEIIVGDDFSTDDTLEKVRNFKNTENIHIRILERRAGDKYSQDRKKNGRLHNFKNIIDNCSGEYIALLDGDDYWTDPYKLQKQVDFLDKNLDYNLVGHYAKAIFLEKNQSTVVGRHAKDTYQYAEIAHKNLRIPTATIVYRNNIKFPEWFYEIYGGDRALIFLNAEKGKLKILDFVGSVYNIHSNGIEQNFKRDKVKFAFRNIREDFVYFRQVSLRKSKLMLKKKILWNLSYASFYELKSLNLKEFIRITNSVIIFSLTGRLKINWK